ncbi:hypothetical protein ACOMHN_029672 [Nucella lapillus]
MATGGRELPLKEEEEEEKQKKKEWKKRGKKTKDRRQKKGKKAKEEEKKEEQEKEEKEEEKDKEEKEDKEEKDKKVKEDKEEEGEKEEEEDKEEEKEDNEEEEEKEDKDEEENLECAVCLDRYRRPKLLSCLHSFCQSCLQEVAASSPSFPCPACRAPTLLPPTGVPGLKSNVYLEEALAQTSPGPAALCDVCAQDREATHRCLQCRQRYCLPCRKFHDSISSCYGHTVVDVQAGGGGGGAGGGEQEEEACSKHRNQSVLMRCVPCGTNLCLQCKLTQHESHPCQDLQEAGAQGCARLQDRLTALRDQAAALQAVTTAIGHRRHRLAALYGATQRGLAQRVGEVKEWADRYQDSTLGSLQTLNQDVLRTLAGTEQGLQHQHAALTAQEQHIRRVLRDGKDVDIVDLKASLPRVPVDGAQLMHMLSGLQADADPYTCNHSPLAMPTAGLQEFVGVLRQSAHSNAALGVHLKDDAPGSASETSRSSATQTQDDSEPSTDSKPAVRITEVVYSRNPKSTVAAICTTSEKRVWIKYRPSGEGEVMTLFGKQGLLNEATFAFKFNDIVTVHGDITVGSDGLYWKSSGVCPVPDLPVLDACFFPVGGRERLVVVVKGDNRVHVVDHTDGCHFLHYLDTGDLPLHAPRLLATDQESVLWLACDGGTALLLEL